MHVESLEVQGSVVRGGVGVVFLFSVDLRVLTADFFICLSMKPVPRLVACQSLNSRDGQENNRTKS